MFPIYSYQNNLTIPWSCSSKVNFSDDTSCSPVIIVYLYEIKNILTLKGVRVHSNKIQWGASSLQKGLLTPQPGKKMKNTKWSPNIFVFRFFSKHTLFYTHKRERERQRDRERERERCVRACVRACKNPMENHIDLNQIGKIKKISSKDLGLSFYSQKLYKINNVSNIVRLNNNERFFRRSKC